MEKSEVKKLMQEYYKSHPTALNGYDESILEMLLDNWYEELKGYDFHVAMNAVKEYKRRAPKYDDRISVPQMVRDIIEDIITLTVKRYPGLWISRQIGFDFVDVQLINDFKSKEVRIFIDREYERQQVLKREARQRKEAEEQRLAERMKAIASGKIIEINEEDLSMIKGRLFYIHAHNMPILKPESFIDEMGEKLRSEGYSESDVTPLIYYKAARELLSSADRVQDLMFYTLNLSEDMLDKLSLRQRESYLNMLDSEYRKASAAEMSEDDSERLQEAMKINREMTDHLRKSIAEQRKRIVIASLTRERDLIQKDLDSVLQKIDQAEKALEVSSNPVIFEVIALNEKEKENLNAKLFEIECEIFKRERKKDYLSGE